MQEKEKTLNWGVEYAPEKKVKEPKKEQFEGVLVLQMSEAPDENTKGAKYKFECVNSQTIGALTDESETPKVFIGRHPESGLLLISNRNNPLLPEKDKYVDKGTSVLRGKTISNKESYENVAKDLKPGYILLTESKLEGFYWMNNATEAEIEEYILASKMEEGDEDISLMKESFQESNI